MQPRQIRETLIPEEPSRRYSIRVSIAAVVFAPAVYSPADRAGVAVLRSGKSGRSANSAARAGHSVYAAEYRQPGRAQPLRDAGHATRLHARRCPDNEDGRVHAPLRIRRSGSHHQRVHFARPSVGVLAAGHGPHGIGHAGRVVGCGQGGAGRRSSVFSPDMASGRHAQSGGWTSAGEAARVEPVRPDSRRPSEWPRDDAGGSRGVEAGLRQSRRACAIPRRRWRGGAFGAWLSSGPVSLGGDEPARGRVRWPLARRARALLGRDSCRNSRSCRSALRHFLSLLAVQGSRLRRDRRLGARGSARHADCAARLRRGHVQCFLAPLLQGGVA